MVARPFQTGRYDRLFVSRVSDSAIVDSGHPAGASRCCGPIPMEVWRLRRMGRSVVFGPIVDSHAEYLRGPAEHLLHILAISRGLELHPEALCKFPWPARRASDSKLGISTAARRPCPRSYSARRTMRSSGDEPAAALQRFSFAGASGSLSCPRTHPPMKA